MIKNSRQYETTKKQLIMLEQSLEKTTEDSLEEGLPEVLIAGTRNGIMSLIEELKKELAEYNELQQKGTSAIKVSNWNDFLLVPIKYRVANKMTIEQFAQKVQVHSRQIASYEKEEYRNVTMSTFMKILDEINFNPINVINNAA